MLLGVILFTLLGVTVGDNPYCDVTCTQGQYFIVKENNCVCSPGFPAPYNKGDYCTVRLSVKRDRRVKLHVTHFNLRYGPDCNKDRLKFSNMHNAKNRGHYMRKVCRRAQMVRNKYIIVNSPQVKMDFRAPDHGESTRYSMWRVCLMAPYSPNNKKVSCPFTMDNMEVGFNRQQTNMSSNPNVVNDFCCVATGLTKKDDAHMRCEPEKMPAIPLSTNGKPTCLTCSSAHPRASVEADITNADIHKKIHCTCATEEGVPIGGNCTGNRPCLDRKDLAFCDANNTCSCPEGYASDPTNSYCGTVVPLGYNCLFDEVCRSKDGHAVCNGTMCVCLDTFDPDYENNFCIKGALVGEDCSGGETCVDIYSRAYCDVHGSMTCKCPTETIVNDEKDACRLLVELGAACSDGEVCKSKNGKAVCDGGTCVCPEGYQEDTDNNVCLKLTPIGEDCTGNLPCIDANNKATCDLEDNICRCPDKYAPNTDKTSCLPAVAIGEACPSGEKCMDKYGRAYCDGSTCVCPSTFKPHSSNTFCTKSVPIGAACSPGIFCIDPHNRASCTNNVCQCPSSTVALPTDTKEYCSANSAYDEFCEYEKDCTSKRAKKCDTKTNKCVCESPFGYHKLICSHKSRIGGYCENDPADCLATNTVCNSNKCYCKYHHQLKGDTVCEPYCQQKKYKGVARKAFRNQVLCNRPSKNKCYACRCEKPPGDMKVIKTNTAAKRVCQKISACHGRPQTEIRNGNKCGE